MTNNKKTGGISILGILFLGFIIILTLSYFNVSIKETVESPQAQENLDYVEEAGQSFWAKYLQEPAAYLWNDVWLELFWRPFIENMKKIKDGEPTDWENAAPTTQY